MAPPASARARVDGRDCRASSPQLLLLMVVLATMVSMAVTTTTATAMAALATGDDKNVGSDSEQLRIAAAVNSATADNVSGCKLCARNGQCERAFRGAPGQFCLTLVSGAPCCCPADAQCVLSNAYNCRCRRSVGVDGNGNSNGAHVRSAAGSDAHPHAATSAGSVLLVLLLACCGCCCCCCCGAARRRKRRHEHGYYTEPLYPATAATATTQYGTGISSEYPVAQAQPAQQPAYPYPYAYASAPAEYDDGRYEPSKRSGDADGSSNSNAFTAAALGAAGGLATGMFLGSAFGGRGGGGSGGGDSYQQSSASYFDGDTGGGFGLDGGDGEPGVSASTLEFSGDTGDIGGNDDGGDFGGDS